MISRKSAMVNCVFKNYILTISKTLVMAQVTNLSSAFKVNCLLINVQAILEKPKECNCDFWQILQIDHSIVESFGGGGKACITARVYPTLAIENDAYLYAFNNRTEKVKITSLSAWSMKKAQIN